MKKCLLFLMLFSRMLLAQAQEVNPVVWLFSANKIADKTYEVHLKATVQCPWTIYSQTTPEGGSLTTMIRFHKNPLVSFTGKPKEVGQLKKKHDDVFEVNVHYYKNSVEFVQVGKIKGSAKTAVSGTVEFMPCNEEQCLPPRELPFTVKIE